MKIIKRKIKAKKTYPSSYRNLNSSGATLMELTSLHARLNEHIRSLSVYMRKVSEGRNEGLVNQMNRLKYLRTRAHYLRQMLRQSTDESWRQSLPEIRKTYRSAEALFAETPSVFGGR